MDKKLQLNMIYKLDKPEHQMTAIQSVVKVLLDSSFSAPLVFLRSPHGDSEIARNGFLDEPSGKAEREDGSKVMRRYTRLLNLSTLDHDSGLIYNSIRGGEHISFQPCFVIC